MSKKEGIKKVFAVALVLCLLCSILVSTAAVVLRPKQAENKELDKKKNILVAASLYEEGADINSLYNNRIEEKLVDLDTGSITNDDPSDYDQRKAASDPNRSVKIKNDPAGIKQRAPKAPVYFVKSSDKGNVEKLILPIHGKGLWSTMYGFIALAPDTKTVEGITFYEHGETPGLGGEIENAKWQASWKGKNVYNENWEPVLELIKGKVDTSKETAKYQIDGLAGATITSRGVSGTIQYWLGEEAFGKFLEKFRTQNQEARLE